MRDVVAFLVVGGIVGFIVILAVLSPSHPNYQEIDSDLYNRCPPGNACLAPHWVVNRLNHDITVVYDGKKERWVMDHKPHDPKGVVVHKGEVAYYQMQLVLPTPGHSADPIVTAVRAHAGARDHTP